MLKLQPAVTPGPFLVNPVSACPGHLFAEPAYSGFLSAQPANPLEETADLQTPTVWNHQPVCWPFGSSALSVLLFYCLCCCLCHMGPNLYNSSQVSPWPRRSLAHHCLLPFLDNFVLFSSLANSTLWSRFYWLWENKSVIKKSHRLSAE